MEYRQIILINSIPVYRLEQEEIIEYRLFENNSNGNIVNINKRPDLNISKELDIIFKEIQYMTEKLKSINTTVIQTIYE